MIHVKMKGFYRIQVHSPTGELRHDSGWFENLITDQGLDWFGANAPNYNVSYGQKLINTHVAVGTGTTTPAFTDTALASPLAMYPAATGNVESFTGSYTAGPPAYWSAVWTYSFATGAVVGNISEVGVGGCRASTDTTPTLFSRALIVDSLGNPTTITVTAADALTVTYELRHYIDTTDNTYSVSINGVTYSGTYRRAEIGTVPAIGQQVDYNINNTPTNAINARVYNGTIGAITSYPSGSFSGGIASGVTSAAATYNPGSYFNSWVITFPTTLGNVSGGVTAIEFYSNFGNWQFGLSPALPKDSTKTLTLNISISWSRYP